jgi:5-methylcytosine-specific restriction endonuclease McrA
MYCVQRERVANMKTLCKDDAQKAHLDRLMELVRQGAVTGTEAWAAFAAPQATKTFKRRGQPDRAFQFSKDERDTFKALRQITQRKLFEQFGRACSYCRRPVGHYGFSWHIEHVLPKSMHPALTFAFANLTVGCVDCNLWKGRRVDPGMTGTTLPIINPLATGFRYADHLEYVQFCTSELNFTKYSPKSNPGRKTYELLSFAELERAQAVNSLDKFAATLHERFTHIMSVEPTSANAPELLQLLSDLKSSIYRRA